MGRRVDGDGRTGRPNNLYPSVVKVQIKLDGIKWKNLQIQPWPEQTNIDPQSQQIGVRAVRMYCPQTLSDNPSP